MIFLSNIKRLSLSSLEFKRVFLIIFRTHTYKQIHEANGKTYKDREGEMVVGGGSGRGGGGSD